MHEWLKITSLTGIHHNPCNIWMAWVIDACYLSHNGQRNSRTVSKIYRMNMDKNNPEMITALIPEIISISQIPVPNVMPKKCAGNQHHAITWARQWTTQAPWTSSARQRGLATPQRGTSAADASELLRPPHRRPRSHRAPFPMEGAINRRRSHGGDRGEIQSRSGEARNPGHGAMHRHCRGSRPRSRGGGGGGGACGGRPVQRAVQTDWPHRPPEVRGPKVSCMQN
jgi:hypothetical protein